MDLTDERADTSDPLAQGGNGLFLLIKTYKVLET